jgi:DMSO/TMAO reductase YedYZ molybdopterin-dependent catalytic subunit
MNFLLYFAAAMTILIYMDLFKDMDRRDVVKFICVLGIAVLIPHSANPKEIEKLLDNEDREGFYIRFIKPIRPIDPAKWSLSVTGLCEKPGNFSLASLKNIPAVTQASRMKCVESWSSKAKWAGFRPKALFDIVKPASNARYLYFYSADDYYEYIPLEELVSPRVLFAYGMNDSPLPPQYGGPLRLLMPSKYGYKSVKSIIRLEFREQGGIGYWSKYGYSKDATIQPGTDHALDLNDYKRITKPGEPDY